MPTALSRLQGPVLALLLGVSVLSGCGSATEQPAPGEATVSASPASPVSSAGGGPSPGSSRSAKPSPPVADASSLTLSYDDGEGNVSTWQLSCEPPSGTHFDPPAACTALGKNGATALPAVPRGKMCTQIYSGPQTAKLQGSYHSRLVNARFSRNNGCETGRWTALEGLLPPIKS